MLQGAAAGAGAEEPPGADACAAAGRAGADAAGAVRGAGGEEAAWVSTAGSVRVRRTRSAW